MGDNARMAEIALFHSVLGIKQGVLDAAARFEAAGHQVLIIDQYEGASFNDYEAAMEYSEEEIGFPELMARAADGVASLGDNFISAGFSNGGGMAEFVATERQVAGVLMFSGAMPLSMITGGNWPLGVPAQIHYGTGDPFRMQEGIDELMKDIAGAGAQGEFFEYELDGHLFTDPTMTSEYNAEATELLYQRAIDFCARVSS